MELIDGLGDNVVSIYKTGEGFLDLCRGPHVNSTGQVKAFKLLSVAGAYWHGIETNPMLSAFTAPVLKTKRELDEYLNNLEEAKKRDHRKLGRPLGFLTSITRRPGRAWFFIILKGPSCAGS